MGDDEGEPGGGIWRDRGGPAPSGQVCRSGGPPPAPAGPHPLARHREVGGGPGQLRGLDRGGRGYLPPVDYRLLPLELGMRLYLARHGDTGAIERYYGSTDIPLSPRGKEQAERLRDGRSGGGT